MTRWLLAVSACLVAAAAFAQAPAWMAVDDFGTRIAIPADRPLRAISLFPALTEIIAGHPEGAGALVGVSGYCDHPDFVRSLPKMGGPLDPDYERILAAKPDLVYAMEMMPAAVRTKLRALGVPLLFFREPRTLAEIGELIEKVRRPLNARGCEAACRGQSECTCIDLEGAVFLKPELVPARPRKPVAACLLLSAGQPLWTAGRGTFLDDLLKTAGCRNAAAGHEGWAAVEIEKIAGLKPDWIFFIGKPAVPGSPLARLISARGIKTLALDEDEVSRPGPRILNPLRQIETALGTMAAPPSAPPSSAPGARDPGPGPRKNHAP